MAGRVSVWARRAAAAAPLALVAGLIVHPAWANHHFMMVREVYAGSPDNTSAQFVELQMYFGGQNVVSGHKVVVYASNGDPVATFVFPGNVGNGANQSSILVATTQAQTVFGVSADLTMTPLIAGGGGKVCFESNSFGVIDCVAWGSYSGSSAGVGTPFAAAEGIPPGASIQRTDARGTAGVLDSADDTNDSANDFGLAEPRPRNNGGTTGQACCSVGLSQASYSVGESAGSATITVARSGNVSAAMTVTYATADGTATAPADYSSQSAALSFAAGQSSASFSVPIVNDVEDEANETVILKVRSPSVGVLSRPNGTLTILGTLSPPGAPQNLAATGGSGQIALGWSPPATGGAPTSYKVYRGTTSGSITELIGTVPASQTSFTDTGLAGGVTRYYQVSAANAAGEGPRSSQASATTSAVVPGPPFLSASQGPGRGEITLTWSPPASNGGATITGYQIYRGTTPGGETFLTSVSGGALSYADSGLPDHATRYYKVSAVNSVGEGPPSNEVARTTFRRPDAPANLRTQPGLLRTTLTWTAPSPGFDGSGTVTAYRIYRGTSSGAKTFLVEVAAPFTTYDDQTCRLTMERVCYYHVAAWNPADESVPSNDAFMVATVP